MKMKYFMNIKNFINQSLLIVFTNITKDTKITKAHSI